MFSTPDRSPLVRKRFRPRIENLETRDVPSTVTGPSSSQRPYVVPTYPGIEITSIMTVGDSVNNKPDGVTPYRPVGIMDGMGAFDNGDGTFTLVMNHELGGSIAGGVITPAGTARAHGNAGAFVSMWPIDKDTLQVLKVEDLLQSNTSIFLSNNDPSTGTPHTGYIPFTTTVMQRLCSADLAPVSAYAWTDPATGIFYGTTARIFQTGEESGGIATSAAGGGNLGPEGTVHFGRQWNMVLTDDPNTPFNDARLGYEMPHCGLFSWENNLASPFAQRKTITMGMDDTTPGQIYVWVGEKQTSGNAVERAGLVRTASGVGDLYVIKVNGLTPDASGATNEDRNVPLNGTFSLELEGDVSGLTLTGFEALSDSNGGTQFLRPEDGQWDPNNPNDYYFVTTDRYDQVKDGVGATVGRSRLYRLRFTDITQPELGGTITAMLDGTEGGNMFDNMTIDQQGRAWLQEDVGGQAHSSKVWMYEIATDELIEVAQHDPARFGDIGVAATAPFNNDEESSGIIDVSHILGPGKFLLDVQAHYAIPGELVEGGQLLLMDTNAATASLDGGVLTVQGTINDESLLVSRHGHALNVYHNGHVIGGFDSRDVDQFFIDANRGNDFIWVTPWVQQDAVITAGVGDDIVLAGAGRSILIGGLGSDLLVGGSDSDILIGGTTSYDDDQAALLSILDTWSSNLNYKKRTEALASLLNSTTVFDDGERDILFGLGNLDWFFKGTGDWADAHGGEKVN